jgi:hypothetical protein
MMSPEAMLNLNLRPGGDMINLSFDGDCEPFGQG